MARGFEWQPETGYLDVVTARVDTGDTLRLDYGYDAGGNITTIAGRSVLPATSTDPTPSISGAWCYSYDGLNRLTSARTGSFESAGQGCADNGGSTDFLGSKHYLAYAYSRDGLASVTDGSSGATASYGYPAAAAPGQPVHGVATITQTGQDPNKVMPVPGGNGGRVALAYDPAGRVSQLTRTAGTKSAADWYGYDDLGNPIAQTTAEVASAELAPSDAPTSGARSVTGAAFDVDGIRVMRRVTVTDAKEKSSTVTTVFLGDTELTFDADSLRRTLTRSHATPGGVPVASEEVVTTKGKAPGATAWTWLVADQQHSIRLAKGPGGVKRTAYLPHGTPLGYGTNPALAPGGRGYLNKTHDPNGDIRLDHRSYQPGLNVLTTPDALLTPYDPQGLNPYAYARNNPIGLSDPSGLCLEEVCGSPAQGDRGNKPGSGDDQVTTNIFGETVTVDDAQMQRDLWQAYAAAQQGCGSLGACRAQGLIQGFQDDPVGGKVYDIASSPGFRVAAAGLGVPDVVGCSKAPGISSACLFAAMALVPIPGIAGARDVRAAANAAPDVFAGVREASLFLREQGVPRSIRKEVLESFDVATIRVEKASSRTFGLRFYSANGVGSQASGRYLFPAFPADRRSLALPRDNAMTALTQFRIKSGATYFTGRVAPNFGQPGGGVQWFVPNLRDLL